MDIPAVVQTINSEINRLIEYWRANPASILTEGDLEAHIFKNLLASDRLSGIYPTGDEPPVNGTKVHCQLKWYDANEQLNICPDITVLDPSFLLINENAELGVRMPSKQFAFRGSAVIIEAKFVRKRGAASTNGMGKDKSNIEFLCNKFAETNQPIHAFQVVFDRFCEPLTKQKIDTIFQDLAQRTNFSLIYAPLVRPTE